MWLESGRTMIQAPERRSDFSNEYSYAAHTSTYPPRSFKGHCAALIECLSSLPALLEEQFSEVLHRSLGKASQINKYLLNIQMNAWVKASSLSNFQISYFQILLVILQFCYPALQFFGNWFKLTRGSLLLQCRGTHSSSSCKLRA